MSLIELLDSLQRDLILFSHQSRSLNDNGTDEALAALDKVFEDDKRVQQALRDEQERKNLLLEEAKLKEECMRMHEKLITLLDEYEEEIEEGEHRQSQVENEIKILRSLSACEPDKLIALATRLALTTAPPDGSDWNAEMGLRMHRPPYPTEDLMRASLLFKRMNIKMQADIQVAPELDVQTEVQELPKIASTASRLSTAILDLDLNPDL